MFGLRFGVLPLFQISADEVSLAFC